MSRKTRKCNRRNRKIYGSDWYGGNKKKKYQLLLYKRDGYNCNECGVRFSGNATIDHIVPISDGGMHVIGNMQLLCEECHNIKDNEHSKRWGKYGQKMNVWRALQKHRADIHSLKVQKEKE